MKALSFFYVGLNGTDFVWAIFVEATGVFLEMAQFIAHNDCSGVPTCVCVCVEDELGNNRANLINCLVVRLKLNHFEDDFKGKL